MTDEYSFREYISSTRPENWPSFLRTELQRLYIHMPGDPWLVAMIKPSPGEKSQIIDRIKQDIKHEEQLDVKLAKAWILSTLYLEIAKFKPNDYYQRKLEPLVFKKESIPQYISMYGLSDVYSHQILSDDFDHAEALKKLEHLLGLKFDSAKRAERESVLYMMAKANLPEFE